LIRRMTTIALLALMTAPLAAQEPTKTAPPQLTSLAGGLTSLYRAIRRNLVEAAELMPEAHYAFSPTPDVRTFGQLVGHVANTQYNFCASARDGKNAAKMNYEMLQTKAELVTALKDALVFCDIAYDTLTDADVTSAAKFGTADITKGYALIYNIAHDNEHYGNMVTYLRLKGLVPPSTARTIKK